MPLFNKIKTEAYSMLKFHLISVSILMFAVPTLAQYDTLWTKLYGTEGVECGWSVVQTVDGGYVVVGETGPYLFYDVNMVKTDGQGEVVWNRTLGGSEPDEGRSVFTTGDGGYIIAGKSASNGAILDDVYLAKTNSLGIEEWARIYGGSGWDWGNCVQQTMDGGYIIGGGTDSYGTYPGTPDLWLIKTDSLGNIQWTRTYGGFGWEECYFIRQTTDGGYIAVGLQSSSPISPDDVYLIKTDSDGDTLWSKTFDVTDYDEGYCVQQTFDGGYIIAGHTQVLGMNTGDVLLIKTDENGHSQWIRTLGDELWDEGYSIQQTADGGYIIAGATQNYGAIGIDLYLVKTDSLGNETWHWTYGGTNDDRTRCIAATSDGGYIVSGQYGSVMGEQGDIILIRLDNAGTPVENLSPSAPYSFTLASPVPNPFNQETTISFTLDWDSPVKLMIFNQSGKEIATLITGHLSRGRHQMVWNAEGFSSGIYFIRLDAGDHFDSKKCLLLK
jgi:hypothetical protein